MISKPFLMIRLTHIILLVLIPYISSAQTRILNLNDNWSFSYDKKSYNAVVPGCIHTDLMKNGLIPDPFFRDNEKTLSGIENQEWVYTNEFYIGDTLLNSQNAEIVFEGLDTFCDVYLNDSFLFTADNMFRVWKTDIKSYLKRGKNTLRINFASPVKKSEELYGKADYKLPGDAKVTLRKAAYHFGWDWGPRLVTSGIWRPARIVFWNNVRLTGMFVKQKSISKENANLEIELTSESSSDKTGSFTVRIDGNEEITKAVRLKKGKNIFLFDVRIPNPKLWWTKSLGEPYLYTFTAVMQSTGCEPDSLTVKTGLRTIELVCEKDKEGGSFYFRLNGKQLFIKGANYIPQDNFTGRITDSAYINIIDDASLMNMNMLRVWGGGIYEKDIFYDLCDEYGILVWQDFMFACAMYPGDTAFVNNVKQEAVDNITRLRNHPCIALWCGNNEIDEGWNNWGWQKQFGYSQKQEKEISGNYEKIFKDKLPSSVENFDPGKSYISTSPKIGWGREESMKEGDSHYWGVWWGMQPFKVYEEKTGRFMSEYGFQGMPDLLTINEFTNPSDRYLYSGVLKSHQKHPTGFETIDEYMKRDYNKPLDFEKYVYVSQLLQAEGMKIAIESHRRAKPKCMGTLYWQFNDCWPVVSWSGRDYYGRWKALNYFVKKLYADIIISVKEDSNKIKFYAISDKDNDYTVNAAISILDFEGISFFQKEGDFIIPPDSVILFYEIDKSALPPEMDLRKTFIYSCFQKDGSAESENYFYFVSPKELRLEKPVYDISIIKEKEQSILEIKTDKLSKNIFLSIGANAEYSDNYFDLQPGITKRVYIKPYDSFYNVERNLKILSLYDTY